MILNEYLLEHDCLLLLLDQSLHLVVGKKVLQLLRGHHSQESLEEDEGQNVTGLQSAPRAALSAAQSKCQVLNSNNIQWKIPPIQLQTVLSTFCEHHYAGLCH